MERADVDVTLLHPHCFTLPLPHPTRVNMPHAPASLTPSFHKTSGRVYLFHSQGSHQDGTGLTWGKEAIMVPAIIKPALFPWANVATMVENKLDTLEPVSSARAKPIAEPHEHITLIVAGLPKLLVAILSWYLLLKYDVITKAQSFEPGWIAHVVIRDLLVTWVGAGSWEWLLYSDSSPFKARLAQRKVSLPHRPPASFPLPHSSSSIASSTSASLCVVPFLPCFSHTVLFDASFCVDECARLPL